MRFATVASWKTPCACARTSCEERNQQLQVLSRAKSDFVARMSHELRTPMNGVLGMTALLLDTRLDAAQRRFSEAIHRSADSLLAIVDDVLDFSKIEAGRLQLDPVECDLVELVEQTAEMLAARAATKGIALLCDSPAQPLPRVRVDAVRLRQVLVNLGGNAVKFTDSGQVTLRVTPLGSAGWLDRRRLEVVDTGVGIEPANQAKIFEEFTQEDASTTRRFGGTGLGLSIARQIVELMGGKLGVVSAPGAGSTFSFELSLPLAEPSAQLPRCRVSIRCACSSSMATSRARHHREDAARVGRASDGRRLDGGGGRSSCARSRTTRSSSTIRWPTTARCS